MISCFEAVMFQSYEVELGNHMNTPVPMNQT